MYYNLCRYKIYITYNYYFYGYYLLFSDCECNNASNNRDYTYSF